MKAIHCWRTIEGQRAATTDVDQAAGVFVEKSAFALEANRECITAIVICAGERPAVHSRFLRRCLPRTSSGSPRRQPIAGRRQLPKEVSARTADPLSVLPMTHPLMKLPCTLALSTIRLALSLATTMDRRSDLAGFAADWICLTTTPRNAGNPLADGAPKKSLRQANNSLGRNLEMKSQEVRIAAIRQQFDKRPGRQR